MRLHATLTRLCLLGVTGLGLSGCLGATRPDAAFPASLTAVAPGSTQPVTISGKVTAERDFMTLVRTVVLTVNDTEIGRGRLADVRIADAPQTPVAIIGAYQGTPVAATCVNREVPAPPNVSLGVIQRVSFADIRCAVNYGTTRAGTLAMIHSPAGAAVTP